MSTIEVPLTLGKVAVIDADDAERVLAYKWHATPLNKTSKKFRARSSSTINGKRQYLHRFLMNADATLEVDHKDGDPLNNRRKNLRLATRSQNSWNGSTRRGSRSGLKGVQFRLKLNKFRSRITFEGKEICLGHFATAIEAAKAYDAKARQLYGEFAKTNY